MGKETETEDFDTFSQHFVDKYRENSMELKIRGAFATTNTSEPTLNGKQAWLILGKNVPTADRQLKWSVYVDH